MYFLGIFQKDLTSFHRTIESSLKMEVGVSGREDHVSAHVFLLFEAFQHNIKALDTSIGKSNKLIVPAVWLCCSVISP